MRKTSLGPNYQKKTRANLGKIYFPGCLTVCNQTLGAWSKKKLPITGKEAIRNMLLVLNVIFMTWDKGTAYLKSQQPCKYQDAAGHIWLPFIYLLLTEGHCANNNPLLWDRPKAKRQNCVPQRTKHFGHEPGWFQDTNSCKQTNQPIQLSSLCAIWDIN